MMNSTNFNTFTVMDKMFVKCFILFCFISLLSEGIEALAEHNSDGNVLQIPSVQRLLNGLNSAKKATASSNTNQHYNQDLFFRNYKQHVIQKPGYSSFYDEGDGAQPATHERKKGEFQFDSNGAVGEGKYIISKETIDIAIKMTLKRTKTSPTISPPTKPTPKTTVTESPSESTSAIAATPSSKPTSGSTTPISSTTTPNTTPYSPPTSSSTTPISSTTTPNTTPYSPPTSSSTTPISSTTTPNTTPSSPPTTNSTPTNSSGNPEACKDSPFQIEALATHNKYRAIHASPAMTLNCIMSKEADEYAQKLADLSTLVLSGYSERPEQGENLSIGCSKAQSASEVVKAWYDEVCKYNFGEGGPQNGTNHFTQVVWKSSLELGLGRAQKDDNGTTCTYIVGRYKPLGDFDDGKGNGYENNVMKGSFKESYCSTLKDGGGLEGGYGLKRFNTIQ